MTDWVGNHQQIRLVFLLKIAGILINTMVIQVVEFSSRGYKIRKILDQESKKKEIIEF